LAEKKRKDGRKKGPIQRLLTVTWKDPMIGASAAGRMSGLNYLRAIQKGEIPPPPFMNLVGFRMVRIDKGRVVFDLKPAEYHYNLVGMVHGGVTSTILDSAMASAIQTTLPVGTPFATVEFKVNFFHPLSIETGLVRCQAHVIHAGSRMATAEGMLMDKRGKLFAHGTLTCLIFPAETNDL
jgi:uncharacterized protein (TIGR00369 family)